MKHAWTRCAALALAAALVMAGCTPRTEEAPGDAGGPVAAGNAQQGAAESAPEAASEDEPAAADLSAAHIAGHVDLATSQTLVITQPAEDLTLESAAYYITGTSDPALPLTLNGQAVEDRGRYGSFAVYTELEWGENVFVFAQGETASETLTITRAEVDVKTGALTRLTPSADVAARSGDETTLTCTGPAGGAVTLEFAGKTVEMEQVGTAEENGVPVTFSATLVPDEVSGTVDMGPVSYTLRWNGEETPYRSDGSLFVVGSGDALVVRARDFSRSTFQDESTQDDYHTPLMRGAVDVVEQIGGSRYLLAMGGWVPKQLVEPLTDGSDYHNVISEAIYTVRESYEMLTLRGSAAAPFTARREGRTLHLTFYHTTGLEALDLSGSALFSGANLLREGDNLVLSLNGVDEGMIGYTVSYSGTDTTILLRGPAVAAPGSRPLRGITVMVDAGHGGADGGADGVAKREGPMEKEITLATALAVQKYLEGYGATVLLTRDDDRSVDLSDRLAMVQQPGVDLMLSLHCNSINQGIDGTGIAGAEVHYYDEISQALARSVLDSLCDATGRRSRGVLNSYFEVTLSANVPSVLVEMGFLTNPAEYDALCDPQEIYIVAGAIADGVVAALG